MQKTILVTNDDGINSPGIKAAVEAVADLGRVIVVAPSEQQTSAGRSLRGSKEEKLIPFKFEVNNKAIKAYSCNSTPALALCHGINVLFPEQLPDLVISGINYGENLGSNITISGTVGAALEAASLGIPAIAVSLQTDVKFHHKYGEVNWKGTKYFLRKFCKSVLKNKLPQDVDILKIDVPAKADKNTDWKITKVSKQPYFVAYQDEPSLNSTIGEAKLKIEFNNNMLEENSDIKTIFYDKKISVCPVSIDMSSRIKENELLKIL